MNPLYIAVLACPISMVVMMFWMGRMMKQSMNDKHSMHDTEKGEKDAATKI